MLIVSCRKKQIDLGDGGFLSSQDGSAPCLLNIIPNVTSKPDVIKILKQNDYYDNCIFYKKTSESASHGIVCFDNLSISINNQSDVVDSVGFQPSTEILVKDVIKKYGPPNMVAVFTDETPFTVSASLYYENINARLDLQTLDGSEYLIEQSSKIVRVIYFTSLVYSTNVAQSMAQKWQGFVVYHN